MDISSSFFFFVFVLSGCTVTGRERGTADDGRPSREETERKSSTSASPFCFCFSLSRVSNYHLRKKDDINQDGALQWRPFILLSFARHTTEPFPSFFFYFYLSFLLVFLGRLSSVLLFLDMNRILEGEPLRLYSDSLHSRFPPRVASKRTGQTRNSSAAAIKQELTSSCCCPTRTAFVVCKQ